MTSRIVGALAAFGFLFTVPTPSLACQCLPLPTPKQALQQADVVFSGTVAGIRRGATDAQVQVLVTSTWKGPGEPTLTVRTDHPGMCGFSFAPGSEYLIYGYTAGPRLYFTSACTRTRLLTLAREDLAALGAGLATPPSVLPEVTGEGPWSRLLAGVGAALVILLSCAMIVRGVRRRRGFSEQRG